MSTTQPVGVLLGVAQPVGVVDPQPVDDPLGDPPQDQLVRVGEDLGVLDPQADQRVDIEEAPVAELALGRAPVGDAVVLLFERGPCAMCHSIAGTAAGGRTAPDLTHIASRSTIGAGTLPNTKGHLAGWIADPQQIKPGNRMPPTGLNGEELQAVLAYLETLQ